MPQRNRLQQSLLSELPKGSPYWRIAEEAASRPTIDSCFGGLQKARLVWEDHSFRATSESLEQRMGAAGRVRRAVPLHRELGLTPEQVAAAEQRYRQSLLRGGASPAEIERLIEQEYLRPQSKVVAIDPGRLSGDYLGFYRFFHATPHNEWGIYIFADQVLAYADRLARAFGDTLFAFTPETLMCCVLFEVFQHEFYHHLVECAATVLELAAVGMGQRGTIYFDYLQRAYTGGAGHPHAPLEEALANAYAYNQFTFVTKRKPTFKRLLARLYQEVLKRRWPRDPAGYRSARHYIGRSHISGNAQLLAMMLSGNDIDPALSLLVAARVMPVGHSAFARKADVPTYIVGDEDAVERIGRLVPRPNETYVSLTLPIDTSELDRYVAACERRDREARRARQRERGKRQGEPGEPWLPGIAPEAS